MQQYEYLIAPAFGWLLAQAIKLAIRLKKNRVTLGHILQSGGMPSSHTTFIVSLATIVAWNQGLASATFAITIAIAAIVAYDSIGVRRTVGEHSDALKELAGYNKKELSKLAHFSRGHNVAEVLVGVILGFLVGTAVKLVL